MASNSRSELGLSTQADIQDVTVLDQELKEKKIQPVDVIICTKNSGKNLQLVLERVFEYIPVSNLIIIDGGSTDETLSIADVYTDKIYFDGGKPIGFSRAFGLELAKTEIVAFIDSDVYIPKNWYKKLIGYFSDPKTAVVTGALFYGCNVKPLRKLYEYKYFNENRINWGLNNALLRRETIIKIGNIRQDLFSSEDIELYKRINKIGFNWVCDNSVISYHPSSLIDYLNHIKWWSKGAAKTGLYSMRHVINLALGGFLIGIVLAIKIHPLFLIYYPYKQLTWCYSFINEFKKHNSRELKESLNVF